MGRQTMRQSSTTPFTLCMKFAKLNNYRSSLGKKQTELWKYFMLTISTNLKEEITKLHSQGSSIADLEEQLENVQNSITKLVLSLPSNNEQSNNEESEKATPTKNEKGGDVSSREEGGTPCNQHSSSVNMRKMRKMLQNAAKENVRSIRAYVTELKECVAKLQSHKQLLVCKVLELKINEAAEYNLDSDDDVSEL
ncbi:hypothetical protein HHK36_030018 [Tetracentron sinense]|uniref:Uncharacterized protein n=1 Tax=Tetracentron sinense TaxID=13715 RepID=A0A834YFT3_TETSI|nr:hypothetical protein HHK36_030018 [Tetracentron sinense]